MYKDANRFNATIQGLITYVPSKPCKRGHSRRWTSNAVCTGCQPLFRNVHGKLYTARYAAKRHSATPAWASLEIIKEIYINCPKGMEVDHELPLQGVRISGLHVEENLRYLSASENASKKNFFQPYRELPDGTRIPIEDQINASI